MLEGQALEDWNARAIRSCEQEWLEPEPERCNAAPVHEPEDDGEERSTRCDYCRENQRCRRVTLLATEEFAEDPVWLCRRCYDEALAAGEFKEE